MIRNKSLLVVQANREITAVGDVQEQLLQLEVGKQAAILDALPAYIALRRLNRLHTVLSKIGEAILRTRDRQSLYDAVCRIVVEHGLLRMVFIAQLDEATGLVGAVSSFGAGLEFLLEPGSAVPLDGGPLSLGTVGTALRTGFPDFCNDIAGATRMTPWRETVVKHGLLAIASFPLKLQGAIIGVLSLCAGEVDYFQDDEIRLMIAVADNLSFALEVLDSERQRSHAEAKLRQSEALLSMAGRVGRLGAWSLDASSLALTWSSEILAIHDLPPDHVPGLDTDLNFYPPEVRSTMTDAVKACLRDGIPFDIELPMQTAKGRRIWVRNIGEAVRGPDGAIQHIRGAFQDISDREHASALLLESQQRLALATKAAHIGISDWDVAANALVWDAQMYQLHGITERDFSITFDEWQKLLHPEDRDRIAADLAAPLNGVKDFHGDFRVVWPNGEVHDLEGSAMVLRSADGSPTRVVSVSWDITERKRAMASLLESQQRLVLATASAHLGIADIDLATNRMVWDGKLRQIYGLPEQDGSVGYDTWQQALHPEDRARVAAAVVAAVNGGQEFHSEFRIVRPDGEVRDLEGHNMVLRAADGSAARIVAVGWDITERKQAERSFKRLNRVYAVLSGITALIVRVRDRDELYREACRIAVDAGFLLAWIGISDRQAMKIVPVAWHGAGQDYIQHLPLGMDDGASLPARAIRDREVKIYNDVGVNPYPLLRKEALKRGFKSMVALPLIAADQAVGVLALYAGEVGFFNDAEMRLLRELADDVGFAMDHIEKSERLHYLAYYDALTGLPNQSLFLQRLDEKLLAESAASKNSRKVAVFAIDIERFKAINDALGRQVGDVLLKQVAERIVLSGGGEASRFARIGADQFAIIASDMETLAQVALFAEERVNACFLTPFRIGDDDLPVSVKIGIALYPDDGADAETLLRKAEAALKKAQKNGDRYLFFSQAMTERGAERLSLENRLRQALGREEFVLHYQPKGNLSSSTLTGAEALIRWNDPRSGLVPPGRFIPILEETGLIHEVGRWALRQAIGDYLRWRRAGLPAVRIAVNVSPLQLRDRSFVAEIQEMVGIDPQAPGGLELEITESLIMEDVRHSIASLRAIRDLGVTIAIDDFGTGFSSLSYLSKLPVDTLKIDRSFIIDMTAGPEGLALVSTIINLAHALKLKVVAEGVETEEQSRLLRLLDCDELQGFLFSKAVPAELFEARFLIPGASI